MRWTHCFNIQLVYLVWGMGGLQSIVSSLLCLLVVALLRGYSHQTKLSSTMPEHNCPTVLLSLNLTSRLRAHPLCDALTTVLRKSWHIYMFLPISWPTMSQFRDLGSMWPTHYSPADLHTKFTHYFWNSDPRRLIFRPAEVLLLFTAYPCFNPCYAKPQRT